jgi:hypothetical protein
MTNKSMGQVGLTLNELIIFNGTEESARKKEK